MAVDDAVDLPGESVDEARLERRSPSTCRSRSAARRSRPSRAVRRARRARPSRSRRRARARRRHTRPRARRRRSSSTCRSRRRSPARRSAPSPRPRSRSGPARPRAARRSSIGMPVLTPGADHEQLAPSPSARRRARTRVISRGTVDERADALERVEVDEVARAATPSSSPVRCASVRDAPALAELVAVVETEDRLRVPDVDREQHRGLCSATRLRRAGGGSPRRSASASAVSTGSSPSPRSSSIVTSPEMTKISVRGIMRVGRFLSQTQTSSSSQVEERVRGLRRVRALELVAEVRRVRREHAVAEEPEDRLVLLLQPELELGLVLVEIVEVRHPGPQCSRARRSCTSPGPGSRGPERSRRAARGRRRARAGAGAGPAGRARRSRRRRRAARSRSSVRGPCGATPSRPARSAARRRAAAPGARARRASCRVRRRRSGTAAGRAKPTGSVSTSAETAPPRRPVCPRALRARRGVVASRSPRFEPRATNARGIGRPYRYPRDACGRRSARRRSLARALCRARRALGCEPAAAATGRIAGDPLQAQEWWLAAHRRRPAAAPGPGVPILIVDSGVDPTHSEFAGRPNTTFLDDQTVDGPGEYHGTAVASLAAAPENGVGLVGVYPQAAFESYDASPAGSDHETPLPRRASCAAAQHCPGVINLSFGGTSRDPSLAEARSSPRSTTAASSSLRRGTAASTGSPPTYPAAYPHVLTVGATDRNDMVAPFSTVSPTLDVSAPGVGHGRRRPALARPDRLLARPRRDELLGAASSAPRPRGSGRCGRRST